MKRGGAGDRGSDGADHQAAGERTRSLLGGAVHPPVKPAAAKPGFTDTVLGMRPGRQSGADRAFSRFDAQQMFNLHHHLLK